VFTANGRSPPSSTRVGLPPALSIWTRNT
jgi:hypothetical protein